MALRGREMTDMAVAAVAGVGLAVLSCAVGDVEPRLRRLTPEPVATRPLMLVYRREARRSPEVRAVIRLVEEIMRAQARRIRG